MITLDEFNAAPTTEVEALLRSCVDIDSFVEALTLGRPWASRETLVSEASSLATAWTADEVRHALDGHPRIGERPTPTATHSSREQGGVDLADTDLTTRLAAGNRAYEERFGHIYLVRAAGRSGEELLALLEQRLAHEPDTEWTVTAEQLAEITLLRLEGLLA